VCLISHIPKSPGGRLKSKIKFDLLNLFSAH
jgi:hypothetical protein